MGEFIHLRDLIPKAAGKLQLQGELKASLVLTRAENLLRELFSGQLSQLIHPKKFIDGVLWCTVRNSTVAQELQQKSHMLRQKLNESLGMEAVKQIRSYQSTPEPEEYHG